MIDYHYHSIAVSFPALPLLAESPLTLQQLSCSMKLLVMNLNLLQVCEMHNTSHCCHNVIMYCASFTFTCV